MTNEPRYGTHHDEEQLKLALNKLHAPAAGAAYRKSQEKENQPKFTLTHISADQSIKYCIFGPLIDALVEKARLVGKKIETHDITAEMLKLAPFCLTCTENPKEKEAMTEKPKYEYRQENDDLYIIECTTNYNSAQKEFRISGSLRDVIRAEYFKRISPNIDQPDIIAACLALAPDHLTLTEIVDYLVAQIPEPKFGPKEIQARIDALEGKLAAVRSEYTEVLRANNACSVAVTSLSNQINIIMNDVSTLKAGLK